MTWQDQRQPRNESSPTVGTGMVHRILGGPPLAVAARLILLSILVGVVLHAIGLEPWNVYNSVRRLIFDVWDMGFDAITWVWRYFLLGAVLVIPIWAVARLLRTGER
jgi:hypothetical protein